MAGSGQLTNDELLKLINQTSSPSKNPQDESQTITSENTDIPSVLDNSNLKISISSQVENVENFPVVSENIPNDTTVHGDSNLNISSPSELMGRMKVEGTVVAKVTHSDIQESVDVEEDMEVMVTCERCRGEGVVRKKPTTDVNSSSNCCDDVDLVSILSKDELTNLIQEYRTELEDSKNKLKRSDRLLTKANDYNTTLRNMVEQLSGEIHRMKHLKTCDVYIQVDKDDFLNYTTGAVTMPTWNADNVENVTQMEVNHTLQTDTSVVSNSVVETEGVSIADSIKLAAEAVVQEQHYNHLTDMGYVYDEPSGLYYHPASGYYYDQNKSLFYDPKTGIYYYFDYNTGTYEFHSQVELQAQQPSQSNVQVQSSQNTAAKLRHKTTSSKKEREKRQRKTPDKKIFKNRRERRQAEAEGGTQDSTRSASNDRHRSRDRTSKRKKRRKNSESESDHSPSNSPTRSRSSGKKRKKRRKSSDSDSETSPSQSPVHSRSSRKKSKQNRKERKVKSAHEDELENDKPKHEAPAVVDVSNASEDDANNSIQCFRNILKLKSSKSAALKRSGSVENLCSYRKTDVDIIDVDKQHESVIDLRHVRAQSESRVDMYVCSSNSELGETEPIVTDSGGNESACEEAVNSGKEIRKSDRDKRHSKRRKSSKSSHKRKKKHKKKQKNHKSRKRSKNKKHKHVTSDHSDTESGELSDSEDAVEDEGSLSESNSSKYQDVSDNDGVVICAEPMELGSKELATTWPPCIRIIVTESDSVQVGTFFMITCTGGKIGRENCDVNIPDLNISKTHAQITYKTDVGHYEVMDLASQNGTLLNQQRLSPAKIASEPFVLKHGDIIQVGSTMLLCHIHPGTDTCDECEPGVVMATLKSQQPQEEIKVLTKEERLRQKKLEMKQIKKKYGLKNSAYEDNKEVFNNPNYTDKAEERRKTVGSDNPGQKHETPASVHRPISTGNVGHKLLQKMGWKEGESLGKNNTGLHEPISVNVRANQTAGLGSSNAGSFAPDNVNTADMKKATRRVQAQQRYKQIESENTQTSQTPSNKQ